MKMEISYIDSIVFLGGILYWGVGVGRGFVDYFRFLSLVGVSGGRLFLI